MTKARKQATGEEDVAWHTVPVVNKQHKAVHREKRVVEEVVVLLKVNRVQMIYQK